MNRSSNKNIDLTTSLGPIQLRNPLVLSSGILGTTAPLLKRVFEIGAGAVTTKSLGPERREGHRNPVVVESNGYILNTVGLPTPGYKEMEEEWRELELIKNKDGTFVLIASIYGSSIDEFLEVAKSIPEKIVDIIELNLSCPNVKSHGQIFSLSPEMTRKVISSIKELDKNIPIMPKLSPNVPDIKELASVCEQAGADMISAINTVGPGMMISIEAEFPILSRKRGGMSGPIIKPIAVRCIYDIYEQVSIPILGIGGVTKGKDAIEMIMAGATAVGIGSGIYYRGIEVFDKVNSELRQWMYEHEYTDLKQLIGVAHD